MSATMARQAGRVQLEQSDMRLPLNMAKMATEGFSHAAIEETKYLIKKPDTKAREEKKRGVEYPWYNKVKAAIQRHPAIFRHNQRTGCLPCQNVTAMNSETRWRRKATGSPQPVQHREPTPEPTPPPPGMPPAPTGNASGAQPFEIVNLAARSMYSHAALPCT